MNRPQPPKYSVFRNEFTVPDSAIDENGHVNNVVYVQWMQDIAILHSNTAGGDLAAKAAGGYWVARTHKIEYLSPAFENDPIEALTWVEKFTRVQSHREYQFTRKTDNKLLARGETDWVFVDIQTGYPKRIPDGVKTVYELK